MNASNGKANPAGMTPTIVRTLSSTRTVLPSASGEAPNCSRQSRSLMMTGCAAVLDSSSLRKSRPIVGATPSVAMSPALIVRHVEPFRTAAFRDRHHAGPDHHRAERLEHLVACTVIDEVRRRNSGRVVEPERAIHPDQLFGLLVRQRLEQHAAHGREHRGCAADAEREHADDQQGEEGLPRGDAERVTPMSHGWTPAWQMGPRSRTTDGPTVMLRFSIEPSRDRNFVTKCWKYAAGRQSRAL